MASSSNNRKAIALIVLVFVLGVALGAVGHTFFDRHVLGAQSPRGVARLTKALNLTPDQQKQIGEILAEMQHRFDSLHQQMSPQFDQIREQGHDQIRQILTPEQRPEFEDLLKQFAEDRRRRNAGSNPHR